VTAGSASFTRRASCVRTGGHLLPLGGAAGTARAVASAWLFRFLFGLGKTLNRAVPRPANIQYRETGFHGGDV
jgi:hypothetical protein